MNHLCSVRPEGRGVGQEPGRALRRAHRHHGLLAGRVLHGGRVQADVGRVRVGEQDRCSHEHHRPAGVPAAHSAGNQHEVPHPRQGYSFFFSTFSYHIISFF